MTKKINKKSIKNFNEITLQEQIKKDIENFNLMDDEFFNACFKDNEKAVTLILPKSTVMPLNLFMGI